MGVFKRKYESKKMHSHEKITFAKKCDCVQMFFYVFLYALTNSCGGAKKNMVKKQVILAKVGNFGGQEVTEEYLAEISKNFTGNVPVVLDLKGHPKGEILNYPKMGEVITVWLDNSILYGVLELQPVLAGAMDGGYYDSWSIGAKQNSSGEFYLHHLALLGEMPPAIKEVRETVLKQLEIPRTELNMADLKNDIVFNFAESDEKSAQEKLKQIEREKLEKALSGKIPMAFIPNVLNLADSFYNFKKEIMCADYNGKKYSTSIYNELANIFCHVKKMVEPGECIYFKGNDTEIEDTNSRIINKA